MASHLMSLIEDGLVCTNCVGGSHANIASYHAQSSKNYFWREDFKQIGGLLLIASFFSKLNESACSVQLLMSNANKQIKSKDQSEMEQSVLIAESREILRAGLRAIFTNDPFVSSIYEATTSEELKKRLVSCLPDLVVVHQSLVTDIMQLPRGRFVILATEPDKNMLLAACAYGARGYFLENASAELLRMSLWLTDKMFLLDPILTQWLLDCISCEILTSSSSEIL